MTTYYVTPTGTATMADAVNPSTPTDIMTALGALSTSAPTPLAAGDVVKIQAGTYALTGDISITSGGVSGTTAKPIIFMACNTSWNPVLPIRDIITKRLSFSNSVVLGGGTYFINVSACNFLVWQGVSLSTDVNTAAITLGSTNILYLCKIYNGPTGGSAAKAIHTSGSVLCGCEFVCSGTYQYIVYLYNAPNRVHDCVVYGSGTGGHGICSAPTNTSVVIITNCLVTNVSNACIAIGTANSQTLISSCILSMASYGVLFSALAYYGYYEVNANIITNMLTRPISLSHSIGGILLASHNHIYGNAENAIRWSGTLLEHGTISTGIDDFRDSSADDYRLSLEAPAKNDGILHNAIGALGIEDVPAPYSVWTSDIVMGVQGTLTLPTPAQVQAGVSFGPDSSYTGTYIGSGGGKRPASTNGGFQ